MDYRILKLDKKHGIPTYDAFMPIVLDTLAKEDCDCRVEDIQEAIPKYYFKLPDKLHYYRVKTGKTVIEEKIYFACLYLFKLDMIRKSYPATYVINRNGLRFLREYHSYKSRYDAFQHLIKVMKTHNHKRKRKNKINKSKASTPISFPSKINNEINSYNNGLRSRILKALFDKDNPYFFEHVVVDLLAKMGYKGAHGKAITTKKSNDGGIDGIINQDPLGTRTICIQAKMYSPKHKVSRPAIQLFNGSYKHNTSRGVFITTSGYTKGAKEEAHENSIVIIDGHQLAELMLEYHVGVQIQHTYQILNIDKDYFD